MWLKDYIFQPPGPIRHVTELLSLCNIAKPNGLQMIYTDGGPDHNISFLNVSIAWLAYFILSRCDKLIVGRTAPTQSWTNPGERVMSVLILAMQNCALGRKLMDEDFEKNMSRCGSMTFVRKLAEKLDSPSTPEIAHRSLASEARDQQAVNPSSMYLHLRSKKILIHLTMQTTRCNLVSTC